MGSLGENVCFLIAGYVPTSSRCAWAACDEPPRTGCCCCWWPRHHCWNGWSRRRAWQSSCTNGSQCGHSPKQQHRYAHLCALLRRHGRKHRSCCGDGDGLRGGILVGAVEGRCELAAGARALAKMLAELVLRASREASRYASTFWWLTWLRVWLLQPSHLTP